MANCETIQIPDYMGSCPHGHYFEATYDNCPACEQLERLKIALKPFADMDRDGCRLDEIACKRGVASDMTIITSQDFRNAKTAIMEVDTENAEI